MGYRATVPARPPAVAGAFYPAEPARLADMVDRFLHEAGGGRQSDVPWAVIVPHAGYVYSGAVAAAAYATIPRRGPIRRIAIAGPAHFVPLFGAAVPVAEAWSTPLGIVPIDPDLRDVATTSSARLDDRPHAPEHSLEVQLPFLQRIVGDELRVLPVVVGDGSPADVADLLEPLRAAADLLVVSSDLSHYYPDDVARRLDRRTVEAILARDPDAIDLDAACGIFALRGLVEIARRRRLPVRLLDQRTSAEASGDTSRVVGYAALAIG
jgi:AmmeMemoRadiSam system protein B